MKISGWAIGQEIVGLPVSRIEGDEVIVEEAVKIAVRLDGRRGDSLTELAVIAEPDELMPFAEARVVTVDIWLDDDPASLYSNDELAERLRAYHEATDGLAIVSEGGGLTTVRTDALGALFCVRDGQTEPDDL